MKQSNDGMMSLLKLGLVLGGGYYLIRASGIQLPSFMNFGAGAPGGAGAPPAGSATEASQTATVPAGSATVASNAGTVPGGSATNAAGGVVSTMELKVNDLIERAAAGSMADAQTLSSSAWNKRMSADEWNWYRAKKTGVETTVDLFPPGNRGYQMTAVEYLAARAAAGLSGLAGLGEILSGDRTYFPLPLTYANDRNPIIPMQIRSGTYVM